MVSFRILAGGYGAFIATYTFSCSPKSCSLRLWSKSATGNNTSWLTSHPKNKHILYAVNELSPMGALQSFLINPDGSLSTPLDTIPSQGADPAHAVALSSGAVVVMNYSSGNGRIVNTTTSHDGKFDANSSPTVTFPQPVGGVSHPHQAFELGHETLVPDLGADTIWRLVQEGDGKIKIQGSIPQPKGSGPRHLAVYNDRIYTLHELTSTLTVQAVPTAPNGTASIIATASIFPDTAPLGARWAAAEILIPTPTEEFPTPYIYVSNRNIGVPDGTRGDSIAIFEHVDQGLASERLVLVRQVYTGLSQIRGMAFGPADSRGGEQFLVASGVAGGAGVIVLQRVRGGRDLKIVARNLEVPTRTSFVWI